MDYPWQRYLNFVNYIGFGVDSAQKLSFLLRISSVNVTKSVVSCGFGHIYWRNP